MMDFDSKVPEDGEVYALSDRSGYIRAEFVESHGVDGAPPRIAWRVYDRFERGVLLTEEELKNLSNLMRNYDGTV